MIPLKAVRRSEKRLANKIQSFLKNAGVREIIDFHTHSYERAFLKPQLIGKKLAKPTIKTIEPKLPATATFLGYPVERSLKLTKLIFDEFGGRYKIVAFGLPLHHFDIPSVNKYLFDKSREKETAGKAIPFAVIEPGMTERQVEDYVRQGFKGFKPYPKLIKGFAGRKMRLGDYLTEPLLKVADKHGLPVMLHVHSNAADFEVLSDLAAVSKKYPKAKIVLAHMGLCRNAELMEKAIGGIKKLENVYLSTSTVMDPEVFETALRGLGPKRIIYGSDFPFGLIRGKEFYLKDKFRGKPVPPELRHKPWLVTRLQYPWTMEEVQELVPRKEREKYPMFILSQINAMKKASEKLIREGVMKPEDLKSIFYGNAARLLGR
jgi:predicted TIM-barrel fold metal-dependent hydrolase